ncbi:hypothetical protein [Alkalibacterium sp. 20]|uniref:hypothetical protein n=1 Tax=Alkalibacterium sp. 20 TaxID=1798803 RepID=UPI0008FFE8D2|nr:hypothetical protein [Alkalibacterium sp. 20]OJF89911.1 hypothetical protein AX762_11985 [Alkalibacterium sp. 20]
MSGFFELGTMGTLEMFCVIFFTHLVLTVILNLISKEHQKAFFSSTRYLNPKEKNMTGRDWLELEKVFF